MEPTNLNTWTIIDQVTDSRLDIWIDAFLIDCRTRNLAPGTLYFYQKKLALFFSFCELQVITRIEQIDPTVLRSMLIHLKETGHNEGGIHAVYRSVKAFLLWYENEVEPQGWKNPIRKVKAPKVSNAPLPPAATDSIKKMIKVCDTSKMTGARDRALILTLLDTGARASELCAMNLEDLDLPKGSILIKCGKGRKPRMVFLGQKTRKAVRAYLQMRTDQESAIWVTDSSRRLRYDGLREVVARRSADARIRPPTLHSFRRQFALSMLRSGVDIFSLQRLMGHTDIQVLRRYLDQTDQDGKRAHDLGSPVDNLFSG
jgi:integrase/recombinase XerC